MSEHETPTTLFPKINGKHRDFIESVTYLKENDPLYASTENIHFYGTVKLHGTHADIVVQHPFNAITFQSRNRTNLTPESDNADFAKLMLKRRGEIISLKNEIIKRWKKSGGAENGREKVEVIIAGEWIGPGIQKRVAINSLPHRIFVICNISVAGIWQPYETFSSLKCPAADIVNVSAGGTYDITLDLNNIEEGLKMLQPLADEAERECPFARNVYGIIGPGEGIVWRPAGEELAQWQDPRFWLKTKGPLSSTGFPKPMEGKVDAVENGDAKVRAHFYAERVVNEMRLQQGWDYLAEMGLEKDMKSVGPYLKWLWSDVEVEEKKEMESEGIDKDLLKKEITFIGKKWFIEKVREEGV